MLAKKSTVVVVKPKNPFESLAISDSDSESEVVAPSPAPPTPTPVPAPAAAPTTPPFRPWPEGVVPPPIPLSSPSPFQKKQRRRGKVVQTESDDGWVSIRSADNRPVTPPWFEPEILYESRDSPVARFDNDEEKAEVEALTARVSALAPPQQFPSLLTRGKGIVLEGKIDASDLDSAKMWADKISKNLKEAEANRSLSFFKRG